MKDKIQTIYINLDDSGALNDNEKFCVYGGILFFSKEEKEALVKTRALLYNVGYLLQTEVQDHENTL